MRTGRADGAGRGALALVAGFVATSACDNSITIPPQRFDPGENPSSEFAADTRGTRAVLGLVHAGSETRAGVAASVFDGVQWETTITDGSGRYRFAGAPPRYDIALRTNDELVFFRELGHRFVDLSAYEDGALSAWSTVLAPQSVGVSGASTEWLIEGDGAVASSPVTPSGTRAYFREFTASLRVHALAFDAQHVVVAHGSAEVTVQADRAVPVLIVPVSPVTDFVGVRVDVAGPADLVLDPVEIWVDFGVRRSASLLARSVATASFRLPRLPGRYAVRVRGRGPRGVSDSALQYFDPAADGGTVRVRLPDVPTPAIDDGAHVSPSAGWTAFAEGVREYTIIPAGRARVRIVTTGYAPVPELVSLGLPALRGACSWTVRSWPDLAFVEALGGPDVRAVFGSATSAPRTVTIDGP